MKIEACFLKDAIKRFTYYKELGDRTFEQLEDEEYFFQPASASNSIAIIIQHLSGNMLSRWTNFLTEDGEKEWRKRDREFEEIPCTKEELLDSWNKGWQCLIQTLESLSNEDLEKTVTIRTERLSVFDAILRQLAHYPYHVGQIVYLGKLLNNKDWVSLSIPKGKSEAFLEKTKKEQAHTG